MFNAEHEAHVVQVTPEEILSGRVKPPASAHKLQEELAKF
jgi:lipid-binding SYLF domain-containing protein